MEIGTQIALLNKKTIMVKNDDYGRTSELVTDFLAQTAEEKDAPRAEYRLVDKIRMAIEVLIYGWLTPGGKRNHKNKEKSGGSNLQDLRQQFIGQNSTKLCLAMCMFIGIEFCPTLGTQF